MAIDAARAKSLFLAASDLADPPQRASYLERECGADAELRDRVEALLRANDAAPLPTVDSVDGPPATADYPDPTARAGAVIAGKYTLVEAIGQGGMGSVWRARQTEPVKRYVAVKLIKAGMDSKAVLVRFEAERQALALMDHPNIAKVLDGGVVGQASQPDALPPRPSAKLSTADALPTLSANRGTEPKKLTGLLRYELDWIVMRALEKDRTRRYEMANGWRPM